MIKVSIIVPVYNVEKYLERCINSILTQELSDFELILINDGSTDSSGTICDKFSCIDNRVKVIHKKNEGVSSARNTGIDIAEGEYIGFVDSDDYIDSDMYKTMYEEAVKKSSDLVICGIYNEYIDKQTTMFNEGTIEVYEDKKILYEYLLDRLDTSLCNKIYKKEYIKKIRLDKKIAINEDKLFNYEYCLNSNKAVFVKKAKYHYIKQRVGSTNWRIFSPEYLDVIYVGEYIINSIKQNNIDLLEEAYSNYYKSILGLLNQLLRYNAKKCDLDKEKYCIEKSRIIEILRKDFRKIAINKYLDIYRKIASLLITIFPNIYSKLYIKYFENKYY